MKKASFFVFLWLMAFAVTGQNLTPTGGITDKKPVYTLFENAVVQIMPGVVDTVNILIHKNKIMAAGKGFEVPQNTVTYDCKGYFIYPSFIEFNSGFGLPPMVTQPQEAHSSSYWNTAIHPEINAADHFNPDEKAAKALQKMGFGYTVSHIKDGIIRGTSLLAQTGSTQDDVRIIKSAAATHFSFNKGSSKEAYPRSLMGSVALLRQTYYDAQWYENAVEKEANYSLEALIKNLNLPACFEVSEKYDIVRLSRIAHEFDKKFIIVDAGDGYQIQNLDPSWIEAMVVPLNFPKPYDMSDPDLGRFVSQKELLHWERAPYGPLFIQEKNIPIILSANGISKPETFFSNLRSAVQKGFSKDEALHALTSVPAGILGVDDQIGKIAPGYLANFFIATSDIFIDEDAKIISHWINGEENKIENPDKPKLEAHYTLNVNDIYFELKVLGEDPYKAEVFYILENDTTKMEAHLAVQSNEVNLRFLYPNKGTYRLSGTIISENRIWNGRGFDPDGNAVLWNTIRRIAKPQPTKTDTLLKNDTLLPPPQWYYPFSAFGFDTLPQAENALFKNATLWTNEADGILENADVFISNGKIVAVGKNLDADAFLDRKNKGNFKEINAKGKHITPGLIDEHSHIAITRGVNEGTQASTAEVRISDALNPEDINILRQLAGGVTISQLLHGSANPIGGQSALIKLRWGKPYEELLFENTDPFIKFALGENVKQSNWGPQHTTRYPQTRMGVEQFYYEYFYRAREYGELKKIAQGQKPPKTSKRKKPATNRPATPFRIDLEMETLLEIMEGKRFITCHSYVQSEINMLMHVADSMGFKINTFTHVLEGYKLADKLKQHGAAASTFSDWWAYKYEVKDAVPHNAGLLNAAGVVTAINSDDAEMARRLNHEAAKSIKYTGMSPEDALKMVTLNPAKMLHIDDRVGSLAPGKDADLVIWSGDPLSVYSMAEKTFVDGIKYFDRTEHNAMKLRDLKNRARISGLMEKAAKQSESIQKPEKKEEENYRCNSME